MDDEFYNPISADQSEVVKGIQTLYLYGTSPNTDGFTQCTCKHRMYLLKCFIEDLYKDMPEFPQQEKEWEQERLIQLLKRNNQ